MDPDLGVDLDPSDSDSGSFRSDSRSRSGSSKKWNRNTSRTNVLHHWTTGSLFLMLGCVNLDRKIAPSLELCRIRRGLRRGRTSAGRRRRGRGGRRSRSGGKRAAEAAAGTNCIKIVLPGKSIRGDYFQENVTSRRPFLLLRISFPGRLIFIQFVPGGNCIK